MPEEVKKAEEVDIEDQIDTSVDLSKDYVGFIGSKFPQFKPEKAQVALEFLYNTLKDTNIYDSVLIILPNWYFANKNSNISLEDLQFTICTVTDFLIKLAKDMGNPAECVNKLEWPFFSSDQSKWVNKLCLFLTAIEARKKLPELFNKEESELIDFAIKQRARLSKERKFDWRLTDIYIVYSNIGNIDINKFAKASIITRKNSEKAGVVSLAKSFVRKEMKEEVIPEPEEEKEVITAIQKRDEVVPEQGLGNMADLGKTQVAPIPAVIAQSFWTWKKILAGLGIVTVVGVGGYFYLKHKKAKKIEENDEFLDEDELDDSEE